MMAYSGPAEKLLRKIRPAGENMNHTTARPVALIPAFKPARALVDTAHRLLQSGVFSTLVVVNDGSGKEFDSLFAELEQSGVVVLRHFINLGKGMALRTGLNHIACLCPRCPGVVTFDADGQHLPEDILAVARQLILSPHSLVLGCRDFHGNIPWRSRVGNRITRGVMRWLGGLSISDTQTGLRGIPLDLIPLLLRLDTRGYDFELDMLIQAREHHYPIIEVPVATVYLDNNRSSHFNPVLDSIKIYLVFLRFNLSSLLTAATDYFVFTICFMLGLDLVKSMILGRLFSWSVNYGMNCHFVFRTKNTRISFFSIYLFFEIIMAIVSYTAIVFLVQHAIFNVYLSKIAVETCLCLVTFTVYRDLLFNPARNRKMAYPAPQAFSLLSREREK